MRIEKIEVSNFKCFENLKLDLGDFNVVIGKNASGKSNVLNILKFIRDMLVCGIDDAIALQGGINYLYNSNIKSSKIIKIKFTINTYNDDTFRRTMLISRYRKQHLLLEKYEVTLHIKANKRGSGYKILENRATMFYVQLEHKKTNKAKNNDKYNISLEQYKKTNRIIQNCYQKEGKIYEEFTGDISEELKDSLEIYKEFLISKSIRKNKDNLLLVNYIPALYYFQLTGGEDIKIYDFNPKNLKSASIINRENVLEEDGSNIANVLQKILKNSEQKKKLLLILKKLLPFIEDIYTEKSFNKSMYFKVKENNKNDLPSSLLSDGTVNIIAIIIALYFERNNDVVIIEEPEKNIHPKLANQLVTLMKDVGHKKQVIITTHNTQLLSSVELKDIIYVYRNKYKYSSIERPEKNKKVKLFIKNELDIGDLFYEGLFTEKEV